MFIWYTSLWWYDGDWLLLLITIYALIEGLELMGIIKTRRRVAGSSSNKIKKHASAVGLFVSLELNWARESLAECPTCWNNILENSGFSVSGGDPEGQRLTIQIRIGLPISTPVSWHGHPSCFWAFDGHRLNRSSPSHIADQHKLKVVSPIHTELNPSLLHAWSPASKTTLINFPPTKNALTFWHSCGYVIEKS